MLQPVGDVATVATAASAAPGAFAESALGHQAGLINDVVADGGVEFVEIRLARGYGAEDDAAHLVGGLEPPADAARRVELVVRIGGRVVEGDGALDGGAGRQADGLLVGVAALPVEVPVVDVKQRLDGAVRQRGVGLGRMADIVHVRADADEVDIRDVVESALGPHRTGEGRFAIEGPVVTLGAQQALGLSLGLHELATNAAKYGALSNADGRVSIVWSDRPFRFEWRETDGPIVVPPSRTGFGSRLIERIVASYFDGKAQLSFDPAGVAFSLDGSVEKRVGT